MNTEAHTPQQIELLARMERDLQDNYGAAPNRTNHWIGHSEGQAAELTDEELIVRAQEAGATRRQVEFIIRLCQEILPASTVSEILNAEVHRGLNKRDASKRISVLIDKKDEVKRAAKAAKAAQPAPAATKREPVRQQVTGQVTEDGIYRNPETGEIFKVQVAVHGSGHLYAKQAYLDGLTPEYRIPLEGERGSGARVEWAYRPGLLSKIKPEWRATMEVAVAFGALYGRCIRCNRVLTREDSIERAMGQVCAGKF